MTLTSKENSNKKILIIGIGNTLYSDEGVGVHLLPYIEEAIVGFENVEVMDGSTDGIKLLGPVEETDYLIVLDAVANHKEPGTVITLLDEEIPKFFSIKMSIHQMGFQEVLAATNIRESAPDETVFFGVQPESLKLGLEMSDTVKKAVPEIVDLVVNQVRKWREN